MQSGAGNFQCYLHQYRYAEKSISSPTYTVMILPCHQFGADGRQAARVIRVPAGRRRDRRLPSRSRDPGDPDTTAKVKGFADP